MKNIGGISANRLSGGSESEFWNGQDNVDVLPERRLMCEILKRAVLDLKGDKLSGYAVTHHQKSAKRWFRGDYNTEHFYSFKSICSFLELDVKSIVKQLSEVGYL